MLLAPWLIATLAGAAPAAQAQASLAAHNRTISLQALSLQQNYRETDTQGLTADGTLNTERGHWQGTALQGRWQGQLTLGALATHSLPLWLQAHTAQATGQTDYNGYLQSGNTLTPYRAKTGNTWRSHSVALGVPLAWPQAPNLQVVPYVQWASQRWQRNLVQYGETYAHRTRSLGVLAQWQPAPGWLLEASHQQGRHTSASLSAPTLGFAASLGLAHQTQNTLAVHYLPSPSWGLQLQAAQTNYTHGASAVVAGLQAPPSASRHTQLGAALAWHY
jgi:hypothetical protein